jgi:hypothetical protein
MAEGEGVEQWVLYFPSVMMEAALGVVLEEAVVLAYQVEDLVGAFLLGDQDAYLLEDP